MNSSPFAVSGYGYVTANCPPFEFELKARPEDFVVEELPLYPACGEGDHLVLEIEKCGWTTLQAIGRLARELGRQPREFGYAGLKDRHALTRQRLSIEHADPERLRGLTFDGLRVLSVTRHTNKLRLGHLFGNHFAITLRGLPASEAERLRASVQLLESVGLPNWFGEQRFGRHGDGHRLGRRLLSGEWREYLAQCLASADGERSPQALHELLLQRDSDALQALAGRVEPDLAAALLRYAEGGSAARAVRAIPRPVRSLQLSALQSVLFNTLLAQRLTRADPWQVEAGDVVSIHANGASFVVRGTESDLEQRIREFEVSPSGPLFGARLLRAEGEVAEAEALVLASAGLSHTAFSRPDAGLRGARRPYRVPVRDVELDFRGPEPVLSFSLPRGSYATSLLEELRKRLRAGDSAGESARSNLAGPESTSS